MKTLNSYVKDILGGIKEDINEAIDDTDYQDEKKILKELRKNVVKFSRKYNHKYAMLKIKLAIGNAGVDIKNLFS